MTSHHHLTRLTPLIAVITVALSVATSLPHSARAEPGTTLRETFALSPAPSRDEVSSTGLSLTVALDWQRPSGWFFGATAGATWTTLEGPALGESSALDPSNLAFRGGHRFTADGFELGLGLHLAAPLALFWSDNIEDKRTSEHNHLTASASRGQRDPWLWQMNTIPVGLRVDLELRLSDELDLDLVLRAEPTALISLNSRPTRLAVASSLELRAGWDPLEVELGWSHLVSTLALENLDHDQHAAWLGLGLDLGEHQVGLTATLNLDGPWGVATGEAKPTWGLALHASHRL